MEGNSSESSHKRRNMAIIVVLLVMAFVFAVPIFPASYQEPYASLENKQETIGSTSDHTLEGGYYLYWSKYIPIGIDIELSVSATDTVDLYFFTSVQFDDYKEGRSTPSEKQLLGVSSGKLGYHVSSSGTYYFVIKNPHSGLFGIGKTNVGIYSASVEAYWQEEVTKYRTIQVSATLWELIAGSYRR